MPDIQHPHDALQDALDGRLDARQLADLQRHLEVCVECRREIDALRWTKAQAAAARTLVTAPPDLEASVRRALDAIDAEGAATSGNEPPVTTPARSRGRSRGWWTVAGVAAAAALLVAVWTISRLAAPSLPDRVASDYQAYRAGRLGLAVQTHDVAAIEAYFRREGITFQTRVFDLRMMQFEALGGRVHRLDGRPSALLVYRGPDGRPLVCQMYEGQTTELPAPARRLTHKGVEFRVYEKDGLTLVFWQEPDGRVTCVLVGDGDPQAVISLAFAKATEI
jgi:anti-sigma factor RsiW